MTSPTYRKKLIEVALPLEAINRESANEKAVPRRGHPATMHLWWARRPLAACRAVIFASLVDDPSSRPDLFPTEQQQDSERQRLFRLIEELVKWENSTNPHVLRAAQAELLKSTGGTPPSLLDPFAGGGSIPLEAQRLGLDSHGADLNPIPVLITKALVEIPPRFASLPPVNRTSSKTLTSSSWSGSSGLAEDVRSYGQWVRDEAFRRIGHLYPKVTIPASAGGGEATVIAWLWARTVDCPNPACGARMPLVRSFTLSTKKGREARVEPSIDRSTQPPRVKFNTVVGKGTPSDPPKVGRGANFRCLVCGDVANEVYVRSEAAAGRMAEQLMATIAEGNRRRLYMSPDEHQELVAKSAQADWRPVAPMPANPRWFSPPMYGLQTYDRLFSERQLTALSTLSGLVNEVREMVLRDAIGAGLPNDSTPLAEGGSGATAYSDAVCTYIAFAISKLADWSNSLCSYIPSIEGLGHLFGRQSIPMVWDFAEVNVFSESAGNFANHVQWVADMVAAAPASAPGYVEQRDATQPSAFAGNAMVCTDPPYYDNIGYADLSDFFYVWLRRSVGSIWPQLFGTLLTPKAEELIASPYRFGGDRDAAQSFFEDGLARAFVRMRDAHDGDYPLTVFYAFKQSESSGDADDSAASEGIASTGWETMLEGLLKAGFLIDGTWPLRTERSARSVGIGTNALASSIVLVCRLRPLDAASTSRRHFLTELKNELPLALRDLQHGNIAPVDLAQAAIGPGMAVFSRHSRVLESDGSAMSVRTALSLINQVLAETLAEQEGEMDADTRWAVTWFDQYGFTEGPFGDADILARAKNTSAEGLVEAGIIASARGKARLLGRDELEVNWNPETGARRTVWEATHHLIRALEERGEGAAATLLSRIGEDAERARDLAYRLFTTCERRGWAKEALAYNSLVVTWSEITRQASGMPTTSASTPVQSSLDI
jgi:putative DNA methylase